MQLIQALAQLDPSIDEHWTSDGLPRMDAVAAIAQDASVTRKMVTDAAPGLMRDNATEIASYDAEDAEEEEEGEEAEFYDVDEEEDEGDEDEGDEDEEEEGSELEAEGEEDEEPPTATDEDIENDVMNMTPQEIFADADLTAIASRAIDRKIVAATERQREATEELRQLYIKCEVCKRAVIAHENKLPSGQKTDAVRAYIDGQNKARELRARRARKFIEAGTTAKDVAAELAGASKLDQAMGARKVKPENKRPAARRPAGV